MKKKLGVFCSRLWIWASNVNVIVLLLQLGALFAIFCQAIAPHMRSQGQDWAKWSSWRSGFPATIPIFIAVIYLRYEEKFRKFFVSRKAPHAWKVRMAELAALVDKVNAIDRRKRNEIDVFRRDVLRCVVSGLAEVLNLPVESLYANFLSAPTGGTMEVLTRTDSLRGEATYDAVEDFLPYLAIQSGKMEFDHDYQPRKGIGNRLYRSIVAIPVTRNNLAYGVLSIDCTSAYVFVGHETRIAYQVRPYTALLVASCSETMASVGCRYTPAHD